MSGWVAGVGLESEIEKRWNTKLLMERQLDREHSQTYRVILVVKMKEGGRGGELCCHVSDNPVISSQRICLLSKQVPATIYLRWEEFNCSCAFSLSLTNTQLATNSQSLH